MPANELVMERHRKHREVMVKKNGDGLMYGGGGDDRDVMRARAWIGRLTSSLSLFLATMQVEPPPAISEDDSTAELARRRLVKGKRFYLGLPRIPYLSVWRTRKKSQPLEEQTILSHDETAEIDLSDPFPDLDTSQDIYRWAVVYENHRGFALAFFVFVWSNVLTSFYFPESPFFLLRITRA